MLENRPSAERCCVAALGAPLSGKRGEQGAWLVGYWKGSAAWGWAAVFKGMGGSHRTKAWALLRFGATLAVRGKAIYKWSRIRR